MGLSITTFKRKSQADCSTLGNIQDRLKTLSKSAPCVHSSMRDYNSSHPGTSSTIVLQPRVTILDQRGVHGNRHQLLQLTSHEEVTTCSHIRNRAWRPHMQTQQKSYKQTTTPCCNGNHYRATAEAITSAVATRSSPRSAQLQAF
jgi:hypothetical protein